MLALAIPLNLVQYKVVMSKDLLHPILSYRISLMAPVQRLGIYRSILARLDFFVKKGSSFPRVEPGYRFSIFSSPNMLYEYCFVLSNDVILTG